MSSVYSGLLEELELLLELVLRSPFRVQIMTITMAEPTATTTTLNPTDNPTTSVLSSSSSSVARMVVGFLVVVAAVVVVGVVEVMDDDATTVEDITVLDVTDTAETCAG